MRSRFENATSQNSERTLAVASDGIWWQQADEASWVSYPGTPMLDGGPGDTGGAETVSRLQGSRRGWNALAEF